MAQTANSAATMLLPLRLPRSSQSSRTGDAGNVCRCVNGVTTARSSSVRSSANAVLRTAVQTDHVGPPNTEPRTRGGVAARVTRQADALVVGPLTHLKTLMLVVVRGAPRYPTGEIALLRRQ